MSITQRATVCSFVSFAIVHATEYKPASVLTYRALFSYARHISVDCGHLMLAAVSALTRKEVTLGESMGGFKSSKLSGCW